MSDPMVIVSAGAQTPLAIGARGSALALRAGKMGLGGAPFAGAAREQILAGFVPTMAWSCSASERVVALAGGAFREAVAALPRPQASGSIAVLLSVSCEARSVEAHKETKTSIDGVFRRALGSEVARMASIGVVMEGETTSADLLPRAKAILSAREADVVLWGGAHSDICPKSLRALSKADRLFDAQHLDAVVPGEAAGFVALTTMGRAEAGRRLAVIAGAGSATTEATPDNDEPVDGDAMTEAVRRAMSDATEDERAGWVLSDGGYEALRLREWEAVQLRARTLLGVPYRWDALQQRFGRPGAAHLPLSAAIAAASFAVGHVPSPSVLAVSGTDTGRRSAIWLRQ